MIPNEQGRLLEYRAPHEDRPRSGDWATRALHFVGSAMLLLVILVGVWIVLWAIFRVV